MPAGWTLRLLLWLVAAGWPGAGLALDPDRAVTQYTHTQWTDKQGLPGNTVQAILQTTDGYLWIGTEGGLARFDGAAFTAYDASNTSALTDHPITDLAESREGVLWVATSGGGLVRAERDRFTRLSVEDGLPSDNACCLQATADGSVWVGTRAGLARIDPNGRIRKFDDEQDLARNHIVAIEPDSRGGVWVGTLKAGIYRIRPGKVEHYTSEDGLPESSVQQLHTSVAGELWVGTLADGFLRWKNGRFEPWEIRGLPRSNAVHITLEDRDGNLWLGTRNSGLWRIRNGRIERFPSAQDLSNQFITSLYQDRDGALWIGTFRGGLHRLDDGVFISYGKPEGINADAVWTVLADTNGTVWAGTSNNGIYQLGKGALAHYTQDDGLPGNQIMSMHRGQDNDLWVGTLGTGIARLHAGHVEIPRIKFPKTRLEDAIVFSILQDNEKVLWLGLNGSMARMDRDGASFYFGQSAVSSNQVSKIFEDVKNNLWVTVNRDLFRMARGKIHDLSGLDGYVQTRVFAMLQDARGVLWFGTDDQGLLRFENERFEHITRRNGLPSDNIYSILEDDSGYLWMSTNKGIAKVARDELDAVAAGRKQQVAARTFGYADGLRSVGGIDGSPSAAHGTDGRLWFAMATGGMAVVDPARIPELPLPRSVEIGRVTADEHRLELTQALKLPGATRRLEIPFSAPMLSDPGRLRFRYRLAGFDEDWTVTASRRPAVYTNLPPGHYRFEVQTGNDSGRWRKAGAALEIELTPRYYQTLWFQALIGLAVVAALWLLYRGRVAWLRSRTAVLEERQRIADDLHDSLAQGLSGIAMLIDSAAKRLPDAPDLELSRHRLQTASELARMSLAEARQTVWNLRAGAAGSGRPLDAVLLEAARRFAADRADGVQMHCGGVRPVSPTVEHHLRHIVQEAVTNAVQHGGAEQIRITLTDTADGLRLEVTDDGRGFNQDALTHKPGRGLGLTSMQRRAKALGGRLVIDSIPGKGAQVTVVMPRPGEPAGVRQHVRRMFRG